MINHGFILLSVQASHEFVAVCGSVLVMCVFKKLQGEARGKLSVLWLREARADQFTLVSSSGVTRLT